MVSIDSSRDLGRTAQIACAVLGSVFLVACEPPNSKASSDRNETTTPSVVITETEPVVNAPAYDTTGYEANTALLERAESAVRTAGLPISESFLPIGNVLPEFTGEAVSGPWNARLVYQSDGVDYKLIVLRDGNCHIARNLHAERVDPERSFGSVDCISYGLWSDGGSGF